MRDTAFIKMCLALPIVCPALVWKLLAFEGSAPTLAGAAFFVSAPLLLYGVPYLGFSAVSVALLWRKTASAHLDFAVRSPFIFGCVLAAFWACLSGWTRIERARLGIAETATVAGDLASALSLLTLASIYGYAYVGLALLLRSIAGRLRLIAP
jgi:hypothetical protein